jgi:hypothetical protein
MLALLALGQAAAAPPGDRLGDPCRPASGSEVVVCATPPKRSPYRLPLLPDRYERKPLRAATNAIPGVRTEAQVQSQARPDGLVDKRVMITFALPF